jgi:Uncharacterised nucleotidyltransferase
MTMSAALWSAVDKLLEDVPVERIRGHKLGPLAARLRRGTGRPVAPALAADERGAAAAVVMARPLLEQIRSLCDGGLVLAKGPEVARLYPGSARTFGDLDLYATEAVAAHRALIEAGYVEVDDPEVFIDHHHLRPLKAPTVGLRVELHTRPDWPVATKPRVEEIFEGAIPAGVGVAGISAPDPVHHALMLAAHAWKHNPLHTLRDLVDIAAVSAGLSDAQLAKNAESWGLAKVWRTTRAAVEALFEGGPVTVPLRTWAGHLRSVRERTVVEDHLMRWLHVFWELPPRAAVLDLQEPLRLTFLPLPGESWQEKLVRTRRSITHPGEPMSRHVGWTEAQRERVGS